MAPSPMWRDAVDCKLPGYSPSSLGGGMGSRLLIPKITREMQKDGRFSLSEWNFFLFLWRNMC